MFHKNNNIFSSFYCSCACTRESLSRALLYYNCGRFFGSVRLDTSSFLVAEYASRSLSGNLVGKLGECRFTFAGYLKTKIAARVSN